MFGGFVGVALLALFSFQRIGGYKLQAIVSDSMRPAVARGSLSLVRRRPLQDYQAGDIISFYPPARNRVSVTHRIDRVFTNSQGLVLVETKGDANASKDPWVLSRGNIEGKQIINLPFLGYVVMALKTRLGFSVFSLLFFSSLAVKEVDWWARRRI